MKRILISSSAVMLAIFCQAQQKQGKVTYERTAQVRINISDNNNGEHSQAQIRTDKFELSFGNNQSLWKQAEKETEDDGGMNNGGLQIRTIIAGSDDILYNNLTESKKVELRVLFDRKFIIDDSIRPLKWKMGEETMKVLNHLCRKATATTVNPRMTMSIDNGVMQRKEIQDTINITAWFTSDVPVSTGPAEYQGQLPGLILALDVNNGRMVYKAVEISEKTDLDAIKAPTGKKHYSQAEFRKERDKMLEEMQQNSGGGNRQIRIN